MAVPSVREAIRSVAAGAVHLIRVDVLDEALQGWHPAWCQVAVLEEDPLAPLYGTAHHGFCPRALGAEGRGGKAER